MSNRDILVRNSFWLGLVEVMSKLIMFGVTVSMVRYFGPIGFGAFNLSSAYVALFLIFADPGISQIANREIAKEKDKTQKYLSNLLLAKLVFGILTLLAIFMSTYIINGGQTRGLIMVVGIYQLCQVTQSTFVIIFTAWERMEMVFLTRLSFYIGIFLATMWTIGSKGSVMDLAISYVIVTVISLIISLELVKKLNLKIILEFDKNFVLILFKESLPLLGMAIVATVYANIDTLLIGRFWGQEKVGFYQAAYKILFAFQSINFINNAIFSRMAVLVYQNNKETLNKLLKMVVSFSLLGLLPLAVIITVGKDLIVTKIYGPNYLIAGSSMAILIWVGVVNYFRILLSNLLMVQQHQKLTFYAVFVGMLVNFGLNYFLIPMYGFSFAAVSLLISEGMILVIMLFLRYYPQRFFRGI